jgi:hypothetical protein
LLLTELGLPTFWRVHRELIFWSFLGEGYDCNLCYLSLAISMNLDYHPLFMNAKDASGKYEVDVPRLVTVVQDVLQLTKTSETAAR